MTAIERDLNFKETELCLGLPGAGKNEAVVVSTITGKRGFSETVDYLKLNLNGDHESNDNSNDGGHVVDLNDNIMSNIASSKDTLSPSKPPAKAQVVGWPPVRSYRKNIMAQKSTIINEEDKTLKGKSTMAANTTCASSSSNNNAAFVKVSMDGAPYLRKVDLKIYKSYQDLSDSLAKMFSSFTMGNYGTQGMIDFMNESKLMDLLNSSEYVPTYEDKDGDWMLVGDVPWEMFVDSCKRLRIMKGSEAIGLAPRAMEKCKSRA